MIRQILEDITLISDDDDINAENYLDSLNYLDNIYKFVTNIGQLVDVSKLTFLPSFKSRIITEKMGILSNDEENELKVFIVKSSQLSSEEFLKKVNNDFEIAECYNSVNIDNNGNLVFILK